MYRSDSLMVSVSGVRGILGEGMNPEVAARFTAAYANWLKGNLIVVGRDTRASGPSIASAVFSVLRFKGIDVVDIGIASTPTVEIMVEELGADGGIIITASHNNEKWNALKFLDGKGEFIDQAAVDLIRGEVDSKSILYGPPDRSGSYSVVDNADNIHIDRIAALGCIDPEKIAEKRFRVAIDCVNGAGSRIIPSLLDRLGVEFEALNTEIDKPFPHDPEPRPANLGDLSDAVIRGKADLGFACDPDADRLVLVDEDGIVLSEELTLSLAADFILGKEKGPVAANLSTTRLIEDIARRHDAATLRSKVGEANVIAVMKESGAVIGGEGNGGVIYPLMHYGRDAMTGIALILQLLAEEDLSLKDKVAAFPPYYIMKEKFSFEGDLEMVIDELENKFDGESNFLDGIRIDMKAGWIHLRRSNTEPVVRIIAEAGSPEEAESMINKAGDILGARSHPSRYNDKGDQIRDKEI